MEDKRNNSLESVLDIIVNHHVRVSNGKLGKVKTVDKEKYLCKVEPNDGSPPLSDVRLTKGAVPKIGSIVAVVPTPLEDSKEDSWVVTTIFNFEEQHVKAEKKILLEVKDGKIILTATDGILLGSDSADEKAVLGNKLVSKLDELMQLLISHTHPGIGSPPAGLSPVDFNTILSDDIKLK